MEDGNEAQQANIREQNPVKQAFWQPVFEWIK